MSNLTLFFILIYSTLSFGTTDPCVELNVFRLLNGNQNEFYSRRQANDCLIKATKGIVPGVKVERVDGGYHKFTYQNHPDVDRHLKQNNNDYFLTNNLIGQFKFKDKYKEGNKISAKGKFKPKRCELTADQCSSQNKNFNRDYCTCEDKEKLYCGSKGWRFEKYSDKKDQCEKDKEKTWEDSTCDCNEVKYCGEKKWSKSKKEREIEQCGKKKSHEWDEDNCTCSEKLYCGEKKWSFSKYERESEQCEKDNKYSWDPVSCSCEIDNKTTHMCNGKPYDLTKYNIEKKACDDKNDPNNTNEKFEWDEDKCSCQKEKVLKVCADGDSITQSKFDRKKARCLSKAEHDDRYSWSDETCECNKEKREKDENSCGGKGWSQEKIDRKKNRCDSIKGEWNATNCTCNDPCYDVEERQETDEIPCEDEVPKIGEVKVEDIQAKVCEKAIPEADQRKIEEQCRKEIEALQRNSTVPISTQKFVTKINYTSNEKVLCSEESVSVHKEDQLDHPLPANVPTTDLSKFGGDCSQGKVISDNELKKYRSYGKISCEEWNSLIDANNQIVKIANETTDEFLKDLGVTGKISKEEMDQILLKSKITLNVIGTANRSNNGTGITLQQLATKRQLEAERVMKEQITKKLKEYVTDANYSVPNSENIFASAGIAQAIGPLNPMSSLKSMKTVLNEPEAPQELKDCLSRGDDTKKLYECSVDYFVNIECPRLRQELKSQFCKENPDAQKADLKSQKTSAFLEGFKMFQVGVNMNTEKKEQKYSEIGTIEVNCSADISKEIRQGTEATITDYLKVTKPGFFRRLKKDCREERKELNSEYGRRNVRRAANHRKNPDGIVIDP